MRIKVLVYSVFCRGNFHIMIYKRSANIRIFDQLFTDIKELLVEYKKMIIPMVSEDKDKFHPLLKSLMTWSKDVNNYYNYIVL